MVVISTSGTGWPEMGRNQDGLASMILSMHPPRRPTARIPSATLHGKRWLPSAGCRMLGLAAILSCLASALGCQPSLDLPSSAAAEPSISVTLEPSAALDDAPAVLRAHLWPGGGGAAELGGAIDSFVLAQGAISDAQLRQLASGEPSRALEERIVPTLRWQQADGHIVVAPTTVLAAGATYTVASGVHDFRAELTVRLEDELPWLRRVWPPGEHPGALGVAVWCGLSPLPPVSTAAMLEPAGPSGVLRAGSSRVDPSHWASASDRCIWFEPDGGTTTEPDSSGAPRLGDDRAGSGALGWLAPVTIGWESATPIAYLEPTPIAPGEPRPESAPLACEPWEVPFGPGCAWVADDRILVQAPDEPLLWVVAAPGRLWTDAVGPQSSLLLHPLPVASRFTIDLLVTSTRGRWQQTALSLTTQPPMPHVVVNEVLANPNGPEPEQEWVELYNDGLAAASLGGMELVDGGGVTTLPDALLEPGRFALLVNETFDAAGEFDALPVPGTLLIRVPRLGHNGLSNDGEPLTLRDADRRVWSRFPSEPKPRAGQSVMRIGPKAPDGDPASFARSEDGPSPGEPNGGTT